MTVERLRNRDLRGVIAGAQTLEDIVDSGEFYAAILPLLNALVPSDITSFNIVDLAAQRSEVPIVDPFEHPTVRALSAHLQPNGARGEARPGSQRGQSRREALSGLRIRQPERRRNA